MCFELCWVPDYIQVQVITQLILPSATSTHPKNRPKGYITVCFRIYPLQLTDKAKLLQCLGSLFFVVKVSGSRRLPEVWRVFLVSWGECINKGFRTETQSLMLLSIRYFFTMGINIYWRFLMDAQKPSKKSSTCIFAVTMHIN